METFILRFIYVIILTHCISTGFGSENRNFNIQDDNINPCEVKNGGCDQQCENNNGIAICTCIPGFDSVDDGKKCEDIDECLVDNGGCEEECQNLIGGYECLCSPGYEIANDSRSCLDVNECLRNDSRGPCDDQCENTEGGFICSCTIPGTVLAEDNQTCQEKVIKPNIRKVSEKLKEPEQDCGPLPKTPNSIPEGNEDSYPVGTKIKYNCKPGFTKARGKSTAICVNENNQSIWTIPDLECENETHCGEVPEVPNSRHDSKEDSYPVGTKVNYKCKHGYYGTGGSRIITCVERKRKVKWTSPKFECYPVSCREPEVPDNAYIEGSRYTFPNSIRYVCDIGYKMKGTALRFCETTGEWSGNVPSCKIVECPEPPSPERGKVSFTSTEYDSTATYECEHGYQLDSVSETKCSAEGVWDAPTPTCIEVTCPEPEAIENGDFSLFNGHKRVGSLLRYKCNEGFKLYGKEVSKCLDNGKWSFDPPICSIPCHVPQLGKGKMGRMIEKWGRLKFDQVYSNTEVEHNEFLILRCNEGYELPTEEKHPRDVQIHCNLGKWNPTPECHPARCRQPPPQRGRGVPPRNYDNSHGSIVTYENSCSDFEETVRSKSAVCDYGSWEVTEAKCEDNSCEVPPLGRGEMGRMERRTRNSKTFNAVRAYTKINNGEVLLLRCQEKYEIPSELWLGNDVEIVCRSGEWNPTPACHPARCRGPLPLNGIGKPVKPYDTSDESIVEYENVCGPLEKTTRKKTARCDKGKWVVTEAKCEESNDPCTVPKLGRGIMGRMDVVQGIHFFDEVSPRTEIRSGFSLLLRCQQGYEIPTEAQYHGDVQIVCHLGTWDPQPACHPARCRKPLPTDGRGEPVPPFNYDDGSIIIYENACDPEGVTIKRKTATCVKGEWSVSEAECEGATCSSKALSKLGLEVTGNKEYKDGEYHPIICKTGYEKKTSNDKIYCSSKGWIFTTRLCAVAGCSDSPPSIEHGEFDVTSQNHGGRVVYRCFPPYELRDAGNIHCNFSEWVGQPGICEDSRCKTKHLEKLDGVKIEDISIPDGSTYQVQCLEGYDHIKDSETLKCSNGRWDLKSNLLCKPGKCIVPDVISGVIKSREVEYYWYRGETITFKKVEEGSVADHGDEFYIFCDKHYKLGGLVPTGKNGEKIVCDKKKFVPAPYCLLIPPITTSAPITRTTLSDPITHRPPQGPEAKETVTSTAKENFPAVDSNEFKNCLYATTSNILKAFVYTYLIERGNVRHKTILNFACYPFGLYRLVGPIEVTCDDGSWIPNFPTCRAIVEADAVHFDIGSEETVNLLPNDVLLVKKNSRLLIRCYVTDRSRWPNLSSMAAKPIVATNESSQDGVRFTSIAIQQMSEEYEGTYLCKSESDEGSIHIVMKRRCRSPDSIANGIRVGDHFAIGSRVHYRCDDGYKLIGESTLYCIQSGEWSSEAPKCITEKEAETSCPLINVTDGLSISYVPLDRKISVGTEVHFSCKHFGLKLIGREIIRCSETGQWTGKPPICVRRCSHPEDIEDGVREGEDFTEGSEVHYRCNKGYKLVGESILRCDENGKWTNETPKCIRNLGCYAIEKPSNSTLIINNVKEEYSIGDSVTFSCPEDQELSFDLEVILCLRTGWSDDRIPGCGPLKQQK